MDFNFDLEDPGQFGNYDEYQEFQEEQVTTTTAQQEVNSFCCICGVSTLNSHKCSSCLMKEIDITQDLKPDQTIYRCKKCLKKYLQMPNYWKRYEIDDILELLKTTNF